MTETQFLQRKKYKAHILKGKIESKLSHVEKHLLRTRDMTYVAGKGMKEVASIFTMDSIDAIYKVIRQHTHEDYPLVFRTTSLSHTHLRGPDAIRDIAKISKY